MSSASISKTKAVKPIQSMGEPIESATMPLLNVDVPRSRKAWLREDLSLSHYQGCFLGIIENAARREMQIRMAPALKSSFGAFAPLQGAGANRRSGTRNLLTHKAIPWFELLLG
jgi:hypothetical protein